MASLPFSSLSATDQGLFSPEELQSLMDKELSRSRRHKYEVVMLIIGVDRLASLGDIYGHESKNLVLEEVTRLLVASTRSCDFLGCLLGDRILALFPHTDEHGAEVVARRIVSAAHDLEFSAGGPQVSVTLTVGIASPADAESAELEALVDDATRACETGQESGGDCWRVAEPATNGHAQAAPELEGPAELSQLMDEMMHTKMRVLYDSMGEEFPNMQGRDSEVFALALQKMAASRQSQDERLELLERRIARLSHNLGLTDEQLQRAMEMRGMDAGVASIYGEVQGLSADASDMKLKKDMMAAIYEANLELQERAENNE
jgi:diguanylate cyclase (GGDEF)-like protein